MRRSSSIRNSDYAQQTLGQAWRPDGEPTPIGERQPREGP
jgi:hypothetical protein